MKYIVYTYNYLTLCKAETYSRKIWGRENTYYIHSDGVANLPSGFVDSHNCRVVSVFPSIATDNSNTIRQLKNEKRIVGEMIQYITDLIIDVTERFYVVVFRDNQIRETTMVETIKKKYENVVFVLIEEGLSIYSIRPSFKTGIRHHIKRLIYTYLGLSTYPLYNYPHGYNPYIEKIICSQPEELIKRGCNNHCVIEKEINVFDSDNSAYLINHVLRLSFVKRKIKFVFLTQPLFPSLFLNYDDKYDSMIMQMINVVGNYGNILIKSHPRDQWDYSRYAGPSCIVASQEENSIPFECLYRYLDNPRTITLYSSAALIGKETKPIFLYDIFSGFIRKDILSDEFIKANSIIRCKSIEELESVIDGE